MSFHFLYKRVLPVLLAMLLLLASLGGCARRNDSLSIFIAFQGENFQKLLALFADKRPDVSFDVTTYVGGSPSEYLLRRFELNDLADVVITSYPPADELQEATLLDLSGYNFVHHYKASVLSNLDVNGKIYLLECPSSVRGIAYNKTLFSEYGWEVPESHEEFTALIRRIRAESDLLPIAIPGKYPGTYFTLMSELSHCDYLQTPDGAEWAERFAKGEASAAEGFQTGISLLQDWLDAGVFDPVQISAGDTTDYEMLAARECAMTYVIGGQAKLVSMTEASSDEFGMFPLYGYGEDSEFVATTYGMKIGLNKRLGEPGNEKKLEKALAFMEFLSTEEGQMVFHTGLGDILPLSGSNASLPTIFEQVNEVVERGHAAPFLYTGYEDILAVAGEYLKDVCYNGGSLSGVFDLMDELRRDSLRNKKNHLAVVSERLDERQTAQFVANALYAQGYGDFAFVSLGRHSDYFYVTGGANGRLYEGSITVANVNIPLSNLAMQNIVTMTLTGAQVRELLENGRELKDDKGNMDAFEYFCAGLTVERDKDGGVKTVLFEGAPLEESQVYTVVFTPKDYSDEIAQLGNPQDTGVAWQDAYRAYIIEVGTITPAYAE